MGWGGIEFVAGNDDEKLFGGVGKVFIFKRK